MTTNRQETIDNVTFEYNTNGLVGLPTSNTDLFFIDAQTLQRIANFVQQQQIAKSLAEGDLIILDGND